MLSALFSPPLLPFTIPALLAVALWLVTVTGALSPEADFGLDADTPVLAWLGAGAVPGFLVATLFLFAFGWSGLLLARPLAGAFGLEGWAATGAAVPLALLGGAGVTRLLGRPLGSLFRTEEAATRSSLVGRVGVVSSGEVTPAFGTVTVRTPSGPVEISARADAPLPYGSKVLIFQHDATHDVYAVAPHAD